MDLGTPENGLVDPYQIPPHFRAYRGIFSIHQYAVFFRPDKMILVKIGGFPWGDTTIQAVYCFLTCLLGGAVSCLGTVFFFPFVISGQVGLAGLIAGAAAPFVIPRIYSRLWYRQNSRDYDRSAGRNISSYRPPVDRQERFLYSIRALPDEDLLKLDKKNHQFLYQDIAYVEFEEVRLMLLLSHEMRVNLLGWGFDRERKYTLLEKQNYRACLDVARPRLKSKMNVLPYLTHGSMGLRVYGEDISADP